MRRRPTAHDRRLYMDQCMRLLRDANLDTMKPALARGQFPSEWEEIRTVPRPGRERITLRVDADVADFFRSLGRGHQRVMNDVLRTFMLARVSELLPEPMDLVEDTSDADLAQQTHETLLRQAYMEARKVRLGDLW